MDSDFTGGPQERAYWRAVRLVALGAFLLAPLFVFVTCLAALTLWQAWSKGQPVDWQAYWASANIAIGAASYVIVGPALISPMHNRLIQAGKVRRAALAANDLMAPLAEEQPADRLRSDVPVDPTIFDSFRRRPSRWLAALLVYVVALTPLQASGHLLTARPPQIQSPFGTISPDVFSISVMLLSITSTAVVVLSIWRALLAFGVPAAGRLAVDDAGLYRLQYRHDRRTVSIRWSDARAFWMLQSSGEWSRSGYQRYALDSGSQLITWEFSSNTATLAEWEELKRLCALIVMRTGLPLRDLTDAAAAHHIGLNIDVPLLTRRIPRLLRWLIIAAAMLFVVLFLSLSVGAWTVQHFL